MTTPADLPATSHQNKHRKAVKHQLAITSIALAVFVSWLGSTAFMTSGPTLAAGFGVPVADIPLALSAYPLALILVCVIGGRLADLLGRRNAFLWAAGAYVLIGLVSPFISTLAEIIVVRALMGAAAGVILAATGGVLVTTMHGKTRHNAWLWWRAAGMAGVVLGPVLGPLLASSLAWRYVAPVSSLLMLIALVIGAVSMKNSRDKGSRFSAAMIAPAALLGVGLLAPYALLVLAKESISNTLLWSMVVVIGLVCITGFIVLNHRLVSPFLAANVASGNARLWLTDSFSALHICGLFISLAAYGIVLETGAGLSTAQTGLALLLMAVPTIGFHLSAHRVRESKGLTRQVQTGIGCGLLALAVVLYYLFNRNGITLISMAPTLVLAGSGFGMLRLFGHMSVIKEAGTQWASALFGARTFGNHTGTALGALVVAVVLASQSTRLGATDPNIAQQAALVGNVAVLTVTVIVGIFLALKHHYLGFEDVHWHKGEPDIVAPDEGSQDAGAMTSTEPAAG